MDTFRIKSSGESIMVILHEPINATAFLNHFPNFCRAMCRPRKAQVVPNRNPSPLIGTSTKQSIARLSNWLLREEKLFRDIRLWKKN